MLSSYYQHSLLHYDLCLLCCYYFYLYNCSCTHINAFMNGLTITTKTIKQFGEGPPAMKRVVDFVGPSDCSLTIKDVKP
ncbi:hypothetical protein LXL04_016256 [Taraxacum kok-saghyz]